MKTTRHPACDECRKAKEKCSFPVGDIPLLNCCRCQRLGKPCFTRSRGRGGRPRKPENVSTIPQPGTQFVWSPSRARPSDPLVSEIASQDVLFLEVIFRKSAFIDSFVLNPVFSQGMLAHLFANLHLAPKLLSDAYIACARRFSKISDTNIENRHTDAAFKNSARAVQALRTASGQVDLVTILTLGLGVITFDLLTSGLHALDICRFTLFAAYNDPEFPTHRRTLPLGLLLPFHFLDGFNCLVQRQVPVAKFHLPTTETLDQYMGVCAPLLPPIFDLCVISSEFAGSDLTEGKERLQGHLAAVEYEIHEWTPELPLPFPASFSTTLSTTILMQAQIHRAALLLIVHRIRYPFGTQDQVALARAREIMDHIQRLYQGTPPEIEHSITNLPSEYRLNFPFLVAAVEIREPAEQDAVLRNISLVVSAKLYPSLVEMLQKFLLHIWGKRDNTAGNWLDWASKGPPVLVF